MNDGEKIKNYSCPLISDRKIIKQISADSVESLAIIKYNQKDFILIGYSRGKFEIYDSTNLELLTRNPEIIEDSINNLYQLAYNTFAVACRRNLFIYLFYSVFDSTNNKEKYHVALIQTIKFETKDGSTPFFYGLTFSKAFLYDELLYKENKENKKMKIEKGENKNMYGINNKLIISGTVGIFLLKRKEPENEDNIKNMDINEYIKYRTENKYIMEERITNLENYDMIQVNYKFLAGTITDYLCLYSIPDHQLITKFEADISDNCDSIIYMINEDILCLGGKSTISLFSIKNYKFVFNILVKLGFRITEICILPNYNILVAIENRSYSDHDEYFYQYKYSFNMNKTTKIKEYELKEVSHKLLSEERSNATMKCLSDNKLVSIINGKFIQIWE